MIYVNENEILNSINEFKGNIPFDHCVIDNFLHDDILKKIDEEFLDYESDQWFEYKNQLENKKACNNWNIFGSTTYSLFSYLNSKEFTQMLSKLINLELIADPGLHGGGLHCHGDGGNLNPHFDYSIHPKLGLQRIINIIIYVSKDLNKSHGGHLGFWDHNEEENSPGKLMVEIEPKYNRAVIFNTSQNSWHGMSEPLSVPEGIYRKSLAIYYLQTPNKMAATHQRAIYSPRESQKNNQEVKKLIKLRSNTHTSHLVYREKN